MNRELPDVQTGFRKAEKPETKLPTSTGSQKKRIPENIYFCFTDYVKACDCVSESEVAQLCLTLCNPMDCSPPGSSVHRIFQARILEWVAICYSRRSGIEPTFLGSICLGRWIPYQLCHLGSPQEEVKESRKQSRKENKGKEGRREEGEKGKIEGKLFFIVILKQFFNCTFLTF